ncbi:MAG: hypothetical protein ABIV51_08560 [Saprospiraceae bacterium]
MSAPDTVRFDHFLEYFPEIELPVTLNDESHLIFSEQNRPLPLLVCEQFLGAKPDDDISEYIACFRLPRVVDFFALVYWEAGLLDYNYYLATYSKTGDLIAKKSIAGIKVNGEIIQQAVATIEPDLSIQVVRGSNTDHHTAYDAGTSRSYTIEMLPDGDIVFSLNEDLPD